MNTVTRTVGGAFGGAASASVIAGTVGASGYPTNEGYTAAFGLCAIALAMAAFLMLTFAREEKWEIYVAAILLGAGIGLAFASMANLIIENVGPEQTGVATGMNTVTRTVGGAFGGAATASVIAGTVGASGYPTNEGYTAAFGLCAIALAIGVLVGFLIPQRRPAEAFTPHATGDPAESTA
jgi:MFS family permease